MNNNCDGDKCRGSKGEVRVLKHTSNPNHGNSILCESCYVYEISFRKERNKKLAPECQYDLPLWKDLKVYDTENT